MSAIVAFSKSIGPIPIDVILTEQHESEIGITSDPIETGAEVNDHAYVMPKKLTLQIADKKGAATYNALVRFQESRVPFSVVTGLMVYKNMLIKRLTPDRDKDNSFILQGSAELQEIIIVDTAVSSANADDDDGARSSGVKRGRPGGAKSTRATRPTATNTTGSVTPDRAAPTVARGDSPTVTVPPTQQQSILKKLTGG